MERYLFDFIKKDLSKKTVLLSGARQVGKTTLSKAIHSESEYLSYDILSDRKIILSQSWKRDVPLLIIDELHKLREWKSFLKGVIDESSNSPNLIVTGSARLDVFRKAGDALTGRTYSYRLHPIDLSEAAIWYPDLKSTELFQRLKHAGGFPESFFNPEDSKRLLNDRLNTLLRDDVQDLSKVTQLKTLELLVELLRERVSAQVSYSNLASDLSVSAPTVKAWIELLEKLYIIFILRPYATKSSKSLRKEPKVYFFDSTAVMNGDGAMIENIVALSLLKWCDLQRDVKGNNFTLHYYRDSNKREVDFVIVNEKKPFLCLEVKHADSNLSKSLDYLTKKIQPKYSYQLVSELGREKDFENVKVRLLSEWLVRIDENLKY
jgi:uncharacterized protein